MEDWKSPLQPRVPSKSPPLPSSRVQKRTAWGLVVGNGTVGDCTDWAVTKLSDLARVGGKWGFDDPGFRPGFVVLLLVLGLVVTSAYGFRDFVTELSSLGSEHYFVSNVRFSNPLVRGVQSLAQSVILLSRTSSHPYTLESDSTEATSGHPLREPTMDVSFPLDEYSSRTPVLTTTDNLSFQLRQSGLALITSFASYPMAVFCRLPFAIRASSQHR